MREYLCLLLALLVVTSMIGCEEKVSQQSAVYTKPTFTPGVLETEHLTAQPGDFDRISDTGIGKYLEIDTGYYTNWWGYLCYAEKTDLNTWYYVCNDPSCNHGYGCSAFIQSNTVWYSDERIYFATYSGLYPHLFETGMIADALFSMEKNGEGVKLEHYYEDFFGSVGSGANYSVVPGGYVLGGYRFLPDGTYDHVVFLYTIEKGLHVLYREEREELISEKRTQSGQQALRLGGDISVVSWFFTEDIHYTDVLCWLRDGEPVFTDISEIPAWGGYLQDNIIRCFDPGKGYYDVDLLTGERTKLVDAQLAESKAMILQPNCIIETTLLNPEANAQTQEMRFFDGQQWHAVALPEELSAPNGTFEVMALCSDRVIFTLRQCHAYDQELDTVIWYCMKLDGETYTVEYMGTFQKPAGASLADQL